MNSGAGHSFRLHRNALLGFIGAGGGQLCANDDGSLLSSEVGVRHSSPPSSTSPIDRTVTTGLSANSGPKADIFSDLPFASSRRAPTLIIAYSLIACPRDSPSPLPPRSPSFPSLPLVKYEEDPDGGLHHYPIWLSLG